MILYLVLICASFAAYLLLCRDGFYSIKSTNWLGYILCVLPVFVFSLVTIGYRPFDAGYDTIGYVRTYFALNDIFTAREVGTEYYGNTELLWWPFQALLRDYLDVRDWLVFSFVFVFFTSFAVFKIVSTDSKINPSIFFLVFLTYYFVYSGNAMRQVLAIPFVFLFAFAYGRYNALALFGLVVAVGFHWSSLIFVLFPFFRFGFLLSRVLLIALPFVLIALSFLFKPIVEVVINFLGFEELTTKHDLYFGGDRESHVGVVWLTVNFWLCVTFPMLYLYLVSSNKIKADWVFCYTLFVFVLIVFGVSIPDFSERYFPVMFFIYPILIVRVVGLLRLGFKLKNSIVISFFMLLWIAVLISESSQLTLGYDWSL